MYLFKIDMTTYSDIDNGINKIGEVLSKYFEVDDFELYNTYKDREFHYDKFEIKLNESSNTTFYFEQFHKQYNFENDRMYGFYRIVSSTLPCLYMDEIEDIIIQYNNM